MNFRTIHMRLQQDDALRTFYEKQMLDHVIKEKFELATNTENSFRIYYLQRHAVKNERGGNIKWRKIFDASSCERKGPSLNDVLEMGLYLLPEVLACLLRFRGHPVSVIGDMKQDFLQLSQDRRDRDLTSFFSYTISKDDKGIRYTTHEVGNYRFTGLPFGLTCSPFLQSVTVRELATMCTEEYTNTAHCYIKVSLWITSAPG